MSVRAYMTLQKQSVEASKSIGCVLPALREGELVVQTQSVTADELKALMQTESSTEGWLMTANATKLIEDESIQSFDLETLLEAEWISEDASLRVKLVSPNRFVLTRFTQGNAENQAYKDTKFLLRGNLAGNANSHATYRHWWQQSSDGSWKSLAQVFMGFSSENEKRKEA